MAKLSRKKRKNTSKFVMKTISSPKPDAGLESERIIASEKAESVSEMIDMKRLIVIGLIAVAIVVGVYMLTLTSNSFDDYTKSAADVIESF